MLNCSTTVKWAVGLAFVAISAYAADEVAPIAVPEEAPPAAAAVDATVAPVPVVDAVTPVVGVPEIPAAAVVPNEEKVITTPPVVVPVKVVTPVKNIAPAEVGKGGADDGGIDLSPPPKSYSGTRDPLRQLGRGVANVVTGVCEIPFNIYNVNKEDGDFAAVTYGVLRGIWRFGVREVVGVGEIITFPFGWKSVVDPEFFLEPAPTTDWRVHRPCLLTES